MTSDAASSIHPSMVTDSSIGFGIEGQVTLKDAGVALGAWNDLIEALAAEVAPGQTVTWVIDQLAAGSLTAEVIAESDDEEVVRRVIDAYAEVGRSLEHGNVVPFERARRHAKRLANLADERIEYVYFEVYEERHVVSGPDQSKLAGGPRFEPSIGAVIGVLRTLSSAKGLRVWIYDAAGHPIRCQLTDEQTEVVREFWGKTVVVEGLVRRAEPDGRPISVTKVRSISEYPEVAPGSWRNAVGLLPRSEESPRSEQVVRRLRDDDD